MADIVNSYSEQFQSENRKQRQKRLIYTCLGVVVVLAVAIALTFNGIAMTGGQTVCGFEEHTHSDSCYKKTLVCGLEEGQAEADGEEVVVQEAIVEEGAEPADGEAADADAADKSDAKSEKKAEAKAETKSNVKAAKAHKHTDACYEKVLVCEKVEHVHSASCYSKMDIDVESQAEWEKTIPQDLKGTWPEKLVDVAKSQKGYMESEYNFMYDKDGTTKRGYTRYGDWYGSKYADWNPLFVEFCLFYSNPEQNVLPYASSTRTWALQLRDSELYTNKADHEPAVGDVIFFDTEKTNYPDQVGIITAIKEKSGSKANQLTVVMGDVDGAVAEAKVDADDPTIDGYIDMAAMEQKDAEAKASAANNGEVANEAVEVQEEASGDDVSVDVETESYEFTKEYRDDKLIVTASYNSDAQIPENAELRASIITEDSDSKKYKKLEKEALEAAGEDAIGVKCAMDIGFFIAGQEIEPAAKVLVSIQLLDESGSPIGEPMEFVHFTKEGPQVVAGSETSEGASIFEIDSFSPFVVVILGQQTAGDGTKLDIVKSADTSDLIELNIYDYGNNINKNYDSNKKYPGFRPNSVGGVTDSLNRWNSYAWGDYITTDLTYGNNNTWNAYSNVTTDGSAGTINSCINSANSALGFDNSASTSQYMAKMLKEGYPALSDGSSLSYLFKNNSATSTTKVNSSSINGLFQYNSTTGEYKFNSWENGAQLNKANNTITLYKQIFTPGFAPYPFGNFLPLNDFVNKSTQSSKFNKTFLTNAANRYKNMTSVTEAGTTHDYEKLGTDLAKFVTAMDSATKKNGKIQNWTAKDVLDKYYEKVSGSFTKPDYVKNLNLDNIYTLNYDEPTNFFFGMEMKMNFMQPRGGLTGITGQEDMIFRFSGDDDVWVYIDDTLFLDLSGIHRHVGGAIDFKTGKVYYTSLVQGLNSATTGDVKNAAILETNDSSAYSAASWDKVVTFEQIAEQSGNQALMDMIDLQTHRFKDGTTHSFNFYYMERGAGSGVCRLNFNMPLIRDLNVSKELVVEDSDESVIGANTDFQFQILGADQVTNDNPATDNDEVVTIDGTQYIVYPFTNLLTTKYDVIDSAGNVVDTRAVGPNSTFHIKAGQRASFKKALENIQGKVLVRELLSNTIGEIGDNGQYTSISVNGSVIQSIEETQVNQKDFEGCNSPVRVIQDGDLAFNFTNTVNKNEYGSLSVSKKVIDKGSEVSSPDSFNIYVKINDAPIVKDANNNPYKYKLSDGTMKDIEYDASGNSYIVLKAGETATIGGILAGSTYEVWESETSSAGYVVAYDGDMLSEDGSDVENPPATAVAVSTNGVSGEICAKSVGRISLVASNYVADASVKINVEKAIDQELVTSSQEFKFTIDEIEAPELIGGNIKSNDDGTYGYTVKESLPPASITLSGNQTSKNTLFEIPYQTTDFAGATKDYYYLVQEVDVSGAICDTSQYVYRIHVKKLAGDTKMTAVIKKVWKNGVDVTTNNKKSKFTNTPCGSLILYKFVRNTDDEAYSTNEEFSFNLYLKDESGNDLHLASGIPAYITKHLSDSDSSGSVKEQVVPVILMEDPSNSGVYPIAGLRSGDSIEIKTLLGIEWRIDEVPCDGFDPTFVTTSGSTNISENGSAYCYGRITRDTSSVAVTCTNITGLELPETGGTGVTIFYIAGAIMVLGAISMIVLKRRRERRAV